MSKKSAGVSLSSFPSSQYFLKNSLLSSPFGLLKADRFIVHIVLPGFLGGDESTLTANALSVGIPSVQATVNSVDFNSIKYYYYQSRDDDTFTITFLEDSAFTIRNLFFKWIDYGFSRKKQVRHYFDEVKSPKVEVAPLLPRNQTMYADVFEDVIPIQLSDINYDVQNNTEIVKTQVTFKYVYHYIKESSIK